LIDGNNRRVAILVHSADGVGDEIILQPGVYKIVAALGMPERLCNVLLRVQTRWIDLSMRGIAWGGDYPLLHINRTVMRGLAWGIARSIAANLKTRQMIGIADGVNEAFLSLRYPYLVGEAWGVGEGLGHILHSMVGLAVGQGVAGGRISGVRLRGLSWGSGRAVAQDAVAHMRGLAWGNGRTETTMIVWTRGKLAGIALGTGPGQALMRGGGSQHAMGISSSGSQALGLRPGASAPAGGWTPKDLAQAYAKLTVPLAQAGVMTLPFNPAAQEPVVLKADSATIGAEGEELPPAGLHVLNVRPVSLAGVATGSSIP
jgi:hypothetical protein